jgi:hypothetical protein
MFLQNTVALFGVAPICRQLNSKELTVSLGLNASIVAGSIGVLQNSSYFSPPVSTEGSTFIVLEVQGPTVDPVDSYQTALSGKLIVGPQEVGCCDPVTLQVNTFSTMPQFLEWDCPECPDQSPLNSALRMETGPMVALGPELFADFGSHETVSIRVRFESAVGQQSELRHSLKKVLLPLPSVLVSGSSLAYSAANFVFTAQSRQSVCDASLLRGPLNIAPIQFLWNASDSRTNQYPSIPRVVSKTASSEEAGSSVQLWSKSIPTAIASASVPFSAIPRSLKVSLRVFSEYVLLVTLGDDLSFAGILPFSPSNALLNWKCLAGKVSCLNVFGSLLAWKNESNRLMIPANEAIAGRTKLHLE